MLPAERKGKIVVSMNSRILLTPRENEVLLLVVNGYNNKEIAKKLYISPNTAKVHVCTIIQKFGVADRVQLAVKAVLCGYVILDPEEYPY